MSRSNALPNCRIALGVSFNCPAESRRSVVNFQGSDVLAAVAGYYARSEQRPVRFFEPGGDEYAMLIAQPVSSDLTNDV